MRRSKHTETARLTRRLTRVLTDLADLRAQWAAPDMNWPATELVVLLMFVNEESADLGIPPFLPEAVARVQRSAATPHTLASALARMVVAAGTIAGTIGEPS
jgi:hypothetical protein